jgi:hypothetical protein
MAIPIGIAPGNLRYAARSAHLHIKVGPHIFAPPFQNVVSKSYQLRSDRWVGDRQGHRSNFRVQTPM